MIWACGATQEACRQPVLKPCSPVTRYPPGTTTACARRGGGVGDDAARRIDPDRARHLGRHPGRIGRKDAALVDHPGGAGVCFAELLDHLNISREVEFRTAQSAWQRQMEHAGVRQGFEERPWEFPRGLDLLGVGADLGG